MYKSTWATPVMIMIAAIILLALSPLALLLTLLKIRSAQALGVDLKTIAEIIVNMSKITRAG